MSLLYLISLIIFITGVLLLFLRWYFENKKRYILKSRRKCRLAIIIQIKNHNKNIDNLLTGIKQQTKDFSNTYIIDNNDINEVIKKKYDLYLIINDNITLDNDFIKEIITSYKRGYDITIPYMNINNSNNVINNCNALTISYINNIVNKKRSLLNNSLFITNNCYSINSSIINKLQNIPNDYELSLYAEANHISMNYNKNAICYVNYKNSIKESIEEKRLFFKNYFIYKKIYLSKLTDYYIIIGIIPYVLLITGLLLFIIANIIHSIYFIFIGSILYINTIITMLITIIFTYLYLMILTMFTLYKEKIIFNLSKDNKIKVILFNPIFLLTYIISFIKEIKIKKV